MLPPLRRLSVWASLTGLLLVGLLAIQLACGLPQSDVLPMLISAVLGFDLFLFSQELMHKARRRG
jgi:hypothetical protein